MPHSTAPRKLAVIRMLKTQLPQLRKRKVQAIHLFGSVARDEATPDSDVDVLLEVDRPFTLLDLADVQFYLEDLVGRSVDVGTMEMLRDEWRAEVSREAIRVG